MRRPLLNPMPANIVDSQRRASDPERSVWVTANAGSGKTYVLTARVLRLLLGGVKPEEILCLTYTKAAAAEMRSRVGERLGRWALANDADLAADIVLLTETAPTAGMTLRARSLFAHALETPGGLKIQTIHAFCESVLHRFPREANVPFSFSVIEDYQRDAMLLEARESVLAAGLRGSGEVHAVETLFGLLSDFQIETAITEALNQQRTLRRVLVQKAAAKQQLRRFIANVGSISEIVTEIAEGYPLTAADHAEIFALATPEPGGTDFVDRLALVDPEAPDAEALFDAFLTQTERTARKTLLRKATMVLIPEIAAKLVAEAARLERMKRRLAAATLLERSDAMLDIVAAISAHYERAKRSRSLLDFDDLVEKLAALLHDQDRGLWVRYKLDSGIGHILVDEGQDTNPQQWEVITALIDEFFHGDSAADRPRTLFVVGDQKQSIFSFQGADPEQFVSLGRQVNFAARAVQFEITPVKLHFSFRTLPNVLGAVDKVFERPDLRAGVLESDFVHTTARADSGGTVTLWPPVREIEDEIDPENWPTEPPKTQTQSAARQVAERIAREIAGWIETRRPLGASARPVTADDILILVQVRSVLFHEIIRALVREGIPTPGADRLAVTTHIATLDMMALGDVLSNSADDLQLAALLRSPLFGISEDELLAVAQPRPDKTSLWSALKTSTLPAVADAYATLSRWRSRLDFERPFNFYSSVLYAEGGLQKLRRRLGAEVDDVMAQFLDLALAHEQSARPSLIGFLAELRSREVIIKRELAEAGAGVRVMTVHGAKGLEAPIVILADAATTEIGRDRRAIYMGADPSFFFHASSRETHADETLGFKDDADKAQKAEYWRKLYVAMTRAEDELYITGHLTKRGKIDDSWYEAIDDALRPASEVIADAEGVETALIYPRERTAMAEAVAIAAATPPAQGLKLAPLPRYELRRIVRPSSAFAADADPMRVLDTAAERIGDWRDPEAARQEGVALHALLQHLSRIDVADRAAVAAKALRELLPNAPERHAELSGKAQHILAQPALAALFGPTSRPELPILAHGTRNGRPVTIAGRIDRLVVESGRVLIVDFKSDAVVPPDETGVPPAYLAQMGLYALVAGQLFPGLDVQGVILWTTLETFMNLSSRRLRDAVAGFTIG
ncbi:MAG: double-strand break repair helicase AddA [Devosia sp.]